MSNTLIIVLGLAVGLACVLIGKAMIESAYKSGNNDAAKPEKEPLP